LLAKDLIDHERNGHRNLTMIEELEKTLKEMEQDFNSTQFALDSVSKQQLELLDKVDSIGNELSRHLLHKQGGTDMTIQTSREDIINKAHQLNAFINDIDRDLNGLVEELNQPNMDIDSKLSSQNILNNYFDALYWIESKAVETMNKVAQIENRLNLK